MTYWHNKNIVVGITGGIAAYKSVDLVRRLRERGANVRVVMTHSAHEFITPLTLQAVSGNPVHTELFDLQAEAAMGHIELARFADLVIVAPASADFMAKLAHGFASDLLTTLCLATEAEIILAPAMNQKMWHNTITQANVVQLNKHGIKILGPGCGEQACGEIGAGRMLEPLEIIQLTEELFEPQLLTNKSVLITAGPTQENIDPVRFLSNHSSGKMGYALAAAAMAAGANVTLISGPTHLAAPKNVNFISVNTALEMHRAVLAHIANQDIFIAAAAVADYRLDNPAQQKLNKSELPQTLTLTLNPDIVADVAQRSEKPFVVGFAAQTHNVLTHAKNKLKRKNLDVIIANQVAGNNVGFGSDDNEVFVLWGEYERYFTKQPKQQLAKQLIHLLAEIYYAKNTIKDYQS